MEEKDEASKMVELGRHVFDELNKKDQQFESVEFGIKRKQG